MEIVAELWQSESWLGDLELALGGIMYPNASWYANMGTEITEV